MRRAHFFWRTLIAVAGALAIAYAWRMAVSAGAPPTPAPSSANPAAHSPVEAYTLWLAGTLIAAWAGYWLGGFAGFVWWLACLRLAWGMAEPALSTPGKAATPAGLAGDLAGAWLLALMPIAGVLLGSVLGRRAYWAVPVEIPLPGPMVVDVSPEEEAPAAVRGQEFRRRDDAYR